MFWGRSCLEGWGKWLCGRCYAIYAISRRSFHGLAIMKLSSHRNRNKAPIRFSHLRMPVTTWMSCLSLKTIRLFQYSFRWITIAMPSFLVHMVDISQKGKNINSFWIIVHKLFVFRHLLENGERRSLKTPLHGRIEPSCLWLRAPCRMAMAQPADPVEIGSTGNSP